MASDTPTPDDKRPQPLDYMRPEEPAGRPQPLDYMRPEEPAGNEDSRRSTAGCLGIPLLLLGLPALLNGIVLLFRGLREPHRFARSDDSYSGMIGLAFGVFCTFVGARWAWFAFCRREPKQ